LTPPHGVLSVKVAQKLQLGELAQFGEVVCAYERPGRRPVTSGRRVLCASLLTTGTGAATIRTYRGPLVVGAANGAPPYSGGYKSVPNGAPGQRATVAVTLAPSQFALKTSDPFAFAYGQVPGGFAIYQNPSSPSINLNTFGTTQFNSFGQLLEASVPSTYSQASPPRQRQRLESVGASGIGLPIVLVPFIRLFYAFQDRYVSHR
jgi:hypothetical protein